jgi:hypothetical protein
MDNHDQDLAQVRDTLPRLWWAIYSGSITAGFSREQSFILLQAYILSQCPVGIRLPPDPDYKKPDDM